VPPQGIRSLNELGERWVHLWGLLSDFIELMDWTEDDVVPCQKALECFLRSLLAVKWSAFYIWRCRHQKDIHTTKVAFGQA